MIYEKPRRIHMNDEDWNRTKRLAATSGRSVSAYIRALVNLEMPKPVPPEEYRKILRELSGACNNINQLTRLSHTIGSTDYERFKDDLQVIYEVRKQLQELAVKPEDFKNGNISN